MTARNMGKNDLWIAATASVQSATLITTDKDFDHLNGVFLPVIYVDPKIKP
jgi:predicted nucleic acid-binding protein